MLSCVRPTPAIRQVRSGPVTTTSACGCAVGRDSPGTGRAPRGFDSAPHIPRAQAIASTREPPPGTASARRLRDRVLRPLRWDAERSARKISVRTTSAAIRLRQRLGHGGGRTEQRRHNNDFHFWSSSYRAFSARAPSAIRNSVSPSSGSGVLFHARHLGGA
jgi:hypothetical protein